MNMEILLPVIRMCLPKNKLADFDKGVAALKEYGSTHKVRNVSDAIRALSDLNVPNDFLSKTGGLAKNPVVSKIASVCNVDVDKIQEDVKNLSNKPVGSLEAFKDDLSRLQ